MARASVLLVLFCAASAVMGDHFIKPYRVGPLLLSTSLTGGEMVRGTVYLTDSDTVFITDFQLTTNASAIFCAGRDGLSNIELPITVGGSAVIPNGHSSAGIEVPLPSGTTATSLVWVGVCATGDPNTVIASAFILPAYIPYLPCDTTTLSQFTTTTTPAPVAGWAFLLNRVTFAVLSFDYSGQAPDAFFWVGAGTPSGTGFPSNYQNNINTALVAIDDQDFLVHLPEVAEGNALDYLAVFCRMENVAEGQLALPMGLVPTRPPPTPASVLVGTFVRRAHNVRGTMHALNSRQIELRNFFFDGGGIEIVFYASSASTLGGISSSNSITVSFENGETELTRAYNDETVALLLPENDAITNYNFLSVWCLPFFANFGEVTIPDNIIGIPALPITSVLVGSFVTRSHEVAGKMHALNTRQIELRNFFFDGRGRVVVFYASSASVLGGITNSNSITVPLEDGSTELTRPYNNETVVLLLPENDAITNYMFLSVWCVPFSVNFGEVTIPTNLVVPGGTVEIPTLPPIQECPVLSSTITTNCYQLHPSVTVSWVVDQNSGTITFNLCGCVRPNEYIAFGLSGSLTGALMVGGDVTWTWLDNSGVYAGDLDLTAYSQCVLATRTGACPDAQDDVIPGSVSGFRDGCTTCIKFSRPLVSSDSRDRAFTPGTPQAVIWSSGPVGSINNVTGTTIPVPFQHYEDMRPSRGDLIFIDFGRAPVDECTLQCVDCEVLVVPWVQPILPHNTTITAQIGNSGGRQGYEGITGTPSWGIAWYLNSLLIPTVTVRRGTTYTFITEGGNDPSDSARYHPFYITDSSRGGFLQKSTSEQQAEIIYAGFTGSTPIGVGRLCSYEPASGPDRADDFSSFEAYFNTLELSCAEGSPGEFTWTPNEETPDIVYYQCATHQFLGWKIDVVNSSVPLPLPDAVNVSFVQPRRSVFEGVEDGAVEVCLNVSGRITEGRNYSVTILGNSIRSLDVDIKRTGTQCHTIRGVVASDGVLRDLTAFALDLRSNSTPVGIVEPSSTTFIVIEDEIVMLNFTRPFFVVTESEGLDEVCVRLELPQGRVIRRPVTFRTHILLRGDRRGRNLPRELSRPQIGYFNIGAEDGDVWCLPVSLTDDEEPEPPRRLQVELFVSDINVVAVRRVVDLTIIDDDRTTPTPTQPTISTRLPTPTQSSTPVPRALEAFFAGDTPRIEGDRLILQVNTNKPASIICRISGTTAADCLPGRMTSIGPVVPGSYAVRAIVTTADERVLVESISVVVPIENACSAHLINRGVTIEGSSARVEFSGAGLGDEAAFVCRLNNGRNQPCTSPLELNGLEPGAQRVRITPQCSDPVFTVARFTIPSLE